MLMPKKNLKICFVTEDFYPSFIGGQGIYGYHLVSELVKSGLEVTVLAENRQGRTEFWKGKNIRLLLTPFCFGNQLALALLEYLLFKFRCSNLYFDILHANQLSGLFFVLLRPKNVGKVIVSVHNTNYDMAQKTEWIWKRFLYQPLIFLEKILYKKADGLLFNSPNEQSDLINYYHIRDKPTKAVYLGVEIPKLTLSERQQARIQIRKDLGVSKDSKIVLYLGRLVRRKKVDTIIKAVEGLDKVAVLIIGQGPERDALQKSASVNVKFLGFVEDTRPYFLAADLFVTISEAEGGFLLSALEAASFALPLIVSPSVAGFPIVKQGINGYIVNPDNAKLLIRRIREVLKKSEQMGRESRKIACRFSWEKCAVETTNFFNWIPEKP